MPGLRGFDGDFSRFAIADLTDHNDIRILAQKRP
jgi:hypothetical protein